MPSIQSNTQVTVIINQQTQIASEPQTPAPQPEPTTYQSEDTYQPAVQKATTPTGLMKLVAGGSLIGGGASALASSVGKSMVTDVLQGPGLAGIGMGAALGAGIGLVNVHSDDKAVNAAAHTAGGALIGLGATGIAQSIGKTIATDYVHGPSTSGVLLGASLGGGIALANADFGNQGLNNAKNAVAGAMIGGGAIGLASSLVKTIASDKLAGFSPVAMGIGMAIGAGIGLLNAKE